MSFFLPGVTPVLYAGHVTDEREVEAGTKALRKGWLGLGSEGAGFERELAQLLGVKTSLLTNSGSSSNLLAVSALTSHKLGERRLRRGDEVITCALGFPTTVAPLVQNNLVPVFVDADPLTLNARMEQFEEALSPRTRAVMMAHTLGNPFDVDAVQAFCKAHDLWLIEDSCDALGSTYMGKMCGSFGDLSTQSFYPPHHITMGEGGAVNVRDCSMLRKLVESFRDWGRDCWCDPGKDNTCGKRFGWQLGELPEGYDHKYSYAHFGYNLKPTEVQAAIGRVQLAKLFGFGEARRRNWQALYAALADMPFDFQQPTEGADPSWFGFMIRVKPGELVKWRDGRTPRNALATYLEADKKIGCRMMFGGNLTRQPMFCQLRKDDPNAFRVVGDLSGADDVMNNALFIGVYPGLTEEMLDYMVQSIREFVA